MKAPAEILVPIGAIAQVHGPAVDIACDVLPPLHQALVSRLDHETNVFEVHQQLDETQVRAITLHRTAGLRRDMPVFDTGSSLHVPVSPDRLSRLVNLFGEALYGKPLA
jgi:F-type H+-transporting ATPase subunit beta